MSQKITLLPKKFVIGRAIIIDPLSEYHNQRCELLIENGSISNISKRKIEHNTRIERKDICISPSWVDIGTHISDPGYEHRETIESATLSGTLGGFSHIAVFPNTNPAVDNKQVITYLTKDNESRNCKILPIAAITTGINGQSLCDLIELSKTGAVAFSDGSIPLENADTMMKALQYLLPLKALLIQSPCDTMLSQEGVMHEGVTSTLLGMKGIPDLAEMAVINRDINIQSYCSGKLHFHQVSSAKSIKIIKDVIKDRPTISCDVSANHLLYTDENLESYDSNYKVMPPFRSKEDRKALISAVNKNIISCITSGHQPCEKEAKEVAFSAAAYGMLGLQTYLNILLKVFKSPDKLPIMQMSHNPRKILGLEDAVIKKNKHAELTIYNPHKEWVYNDSSNASISSNTPLFGQKLTGQVIGGVNRENAWIYG